MLKRLYILILLITLPILNGFAQTLSATEIAKNALDRDDGKTSYSKSNLLSCRFKETNDKKKCTSTPRKKLLESLEKDIGKNDKDKLMLSIIVEPPNEHGMAFLQKDYDDPDKESDQWMYLPALKKFKRIISESGQGPKTGTIFGSEFSYEDMEKRHLNDYTYKTVGEEMIQDRDSWIIETKPTKKRALKTSYSHLKLWVSKDDFLTMKTEMFDRQNKLVKTLHYRRWKNMKNVWYPFQMIMVNHKALRMSMIQMQNLALNEPVEEDLFKIRALQDSDFRESKLKTIRNKAK